MRGRFLLFQQNVVVAPISAVKVKRQRKNREKGPICYNNEWLLRNKFLSGKIYVF